ncbi:MAG: prenyltransferase [Leptolyngbya foveolarum]|uniref:Prenyltransferase n=1 Tax=Leptolyngbya foveolarum TaxID=47253 RepID=A0A2W4TM19_9CYAN|nr:MAG: prenyltransferase [Leptolyngbya foveolarum]
MSSPDETIAIEPPFSKKELEKAQATDVEALAQSIDNSFVNPFLDPAHIEKAARGRISNQADLYRSLVRALKRRRGFGILFLQCTPAKGKEIFSQLQTDLPQKQIGQLTLTEPIENLKALVEAREDLDELNVLFVEGIEHSLSPYIKSEMGRNDYYKLEVLPPILDHLNLHRENFRNQFRHLCLVFVVPPFALKYFMYRAVDFFSWHSGIWTFSPPEEELAKATVRVLEGKYSEYLSLSTEESVERIVELRDLIDQKNQPDEKRSLLLVELALVLYAAQDFELALDCCDEAITFQSANENAWFTKGVALVALGRTEEAIAAYDAALAIKPDDHEAFFNKGNALAALGRNEEAITAYDVALAIKPDFREAFFNKGVDLAALGRNEEAIASFDAALAIKPNNPDTYYYKACIYALLLQLKDAITFLQKAIALDGTDEYIELAKTDSDFDAIRDRPPFQALIAQYEEKQHSEARSL